MQMFTDNSTITNHQTAKNFNFMKPVDGRVVPPFTVGVSSQTRDVFLSILPELISTRHGKSHQSQVNLKYAYRWKEIKPNMLAMPPDKVYKSRLCRNNPGHAC